MARGIAVPAPNSISTTHRVLRFLRKHWIWLVLVATSFSLIPWLIGPACPSEIVIATGRADGNYYAFAQRYQELLRPHGIELKIETTSGSIDNLNLITETGAQVDLAFIQGGTHGSNDESALKSLASLYYEPVWVFCNADDVEDLNDLAGKRVAIDHPGSGTHQLAKSLLELNGITGDNDTELVELGGREAAAAIESGEIDAAFFVVSPESELIKQLLGSKNVVLMNLRRARAYASRYQYLSKVTLPEGYFDLVANIPRQEVQLLAPSANLVATQSLHPALIPLLLDVAERVHETGGCFARFGEFPNTHFVDFPVAEDARRYFHSGPSPLYRWLPFHWASWLDRMKLLLVPMCTLLFPLIKVAPPIYRRQIRCKIYRWYKVLRQIDLELDGGETIDLPSNLKRLDTLESELAEITVPLSYMEEFYNLRLHVEHVRSRIQVKTIGVDFSSPNLTSARRAA